MYERQRWRQNIVSQNNRTSLKHDESIFFAWSVYDDSLIAGLFPDLTRLRSEWEARPLLSKVSYSQQQAVAPLHSIPTIFHNRSKVLNSNCHSNAKKNDPLLSLFGLEDAIEVLSHPNMNNKHGSAYRIVQKIVKDGEEFQGTLPRRHYTIEQITSSFHTRGMSVVINDMQRRWYSIASMARQIEEELGSAKVGANLYLTPEVEMIEESIKKNGLTRQGFDAHWDMMDVIIIQLTGRKRWSVAREPNVYLSHKDKKRKPSIEEVEYYARDNHFLEFSLCPGDVLYIPRGHMHNASTIAFNQQKRKWADWDDCPSNSKDLSEMHSLPMSLNAPSLHLTFGLDPTFTVEALLHHALRAYFESVSTVENNVAISAMRCSNTAQIAVGNGYDVEWQTILHHALAELSRRENDCDAPSYRGIDNPRQCDGNVLLRKTVPLLLLTNNKLVEKSLDVKRQVDMRILKKAYIAALDFFESFASLPKTLDFVELHVLQPICDHCPDLAFSYPGYQQNQHGILCPSELNSLAEAEFEGILQNSVQFAEKILLRP
mmetsp:Transcript_47001/g.98577  ORF Transcript_47001/g.98577 Transcript_47001/m.98577 type:complete len:544 (+) Transcript_47001:81-1712(+)